MPTHTILKKWIGKHVSTRLIRWLISLKDAPRFTENYGDFKTISHYKSYAIGGVPNESGQVRGEIVFLLKKNKDTIKTLFLPGEKNIVKPIFSTLAATPVEAITTAGLSSDMDWHWDFEESPPEFGLFDCIISQAILEHLVDPYRHICDLTKHLAPNGFLIVHSVTPGFNYHRYPVDCMRFYPDWFEEIGKRLELDVLEKYIGSGHLTYIFQKTN